MRQKRIGLLVPSSNSVMEVDFYRGVPENVTVHTSRMFMTETTPEGENRMLDEFTEPAAMAVATARPHVVVFGCTSAGALRGDDYDAKLCQRLEQIMGVPVISVISSVREAIYKIRPKKVGVITPYIEELNQKIRQSLEADGVNISDVHGLGMTDNFQIAEIPPEQIVRFAKRTFQEDDIDLLFVSCTNFHGVAAIEQLEQVLGIPVVTSNQVALEATLEVLGMASPVRSQGSPRVPA